MLAATVDSSFGYFGNFVTSALSFINGFIIPFILALIVLVFFWGVFKYFILGGADEGKREEGRKLILYSIVGLVVAVAIYGIINIFVGALGIDAKTKIELPSVPGVR